MWTPVPDPDDKPDNSPKMKIIFVVLFLFLIGELVYFFYIVPNKKITTTIVPTFMPTQTNIVKNLPTKSSPSTQEFHGQISKIEFKNNKISKITFRLNLTEKSIDNSKAKNFDFTIENDNIKNLVILSRNGKTLTQVDLKVGQIITFDTTSQLTIIIDNIK